MKLSVLTALLAFLTANYAGASQVTLLKRMTCENSNLRVQVDVSHESGDRIALVQWRVFADGKRLDFFMAPLNYQDRSLVSFGGSTLGSDIWIEGDRAELSLRDDVFALKCR